MKLPWNSHSGFNPHLAAGLTASAWSMLLQMACVPLYIRFLGVEAYGLIGFYLMLQAILQVLDLGLSPTMNREMARYWVSAGKGGRGTRSCAYAGAWLLAHWIDDRIGLSDCLAMGCGSLDQSQWHSCSQCPACIDVDGHFGRSPMARQFLSGRIAGIASRGLFQCLQNHCIDCDNGGAVLVLWIISPTIQAFFLWLVVTNAVTLVCWTVFLWKSLPAATRSPEFRLALLRNIVGFAAGMSGMTAAALILTQSDKVILSSVLSLKMFGFYTLGGMFGAGLSMIVTSVFNTAYPRFSALVAQGDEQALVRLYHMSTQLMAVLILPLATVLAFFSTDILQLWTRGSQVAQGAGPIATLSVIGSALNGLMFSPYALQLAYGWTSIGLRITIQFNYHLSVPAIWFMATTYGGVGRCVNVARFQLRVHGNRRSTDASPPMKRAGVAMVG